MTLPDELLNAPITDLTYDTDEALKAAVAFIESGAPITEGKVNLTPDPEGGTTDGTDEPSTPSTPPTPSTPSQPAPPTTGKDEPQKEPHSPAYVASVWTVFSVLALITLCMLILGLYKRRHKKSEEDPLFSEGAPARPQNGGNHEDTNNLE